MAARLAVAIENSFGLRPELIEGDGGIFDVTVDGQLVFSKQEAEELAETADVVELVRAHVMAQAFG